MVEVGHTLRRDAVGIGHTVRRDDGTVIRIDARHLREDGSSMYLVTKVGHTSQSAGPFDEIKQWLMPAEEVEKYPRVQSINVWMTKEEAEERFSSKETVGNPLVTDLLTPSIDGNVSGSTNSIYFYGDIFED